MSKRKICVVTATRAEYGLLYWLMKEIKDDEDLQLQLLVTGIHLCEEFGNTYKEIEKEFKIDKKIDISLTNDSAVGICKSMGIAQSSFSKAFYELNPDIVVILGDRYEMLSVSIAAMISNIPIAHLHGGELTQGVYDDAIRHSITKMSHLHFTATAEYKNRVIQLGEDPNRVFNVGGLGIDNINKINLLSKEDFEKSINFKLNQRNLLVTFHPVTLENESSQVQFQELLDALDNLENTNIILTYANADTNGRIINEMIESYVKNHKETCIAFKSLGQLLYLSALQFMDAVVGNSSSGLLETPSFNIFTINIGNRQEGRIKANSVIDCEANKTSILESIIDIYSNKNKNKLEKIVNPYGCGGASVKIKNVIKSFNLDHILNKTFYNL
ncbi:UDP-N-acetylglucosamine 2-epimerase (hydrolyzing) [Arcobacter sp. HD9-500m-PIT-SAG03]|nr:UDP-N-acetylglucosamine 2-epimerase (hydrolyzing) [Arcobacter sp. HD9-500m-PIT-SAG03]